MKDISERLKKLDCPDETAQLIISTLNEVKSYGDKPVSKEVENGIHKEISRIIKDED